MTAQAILTISAVIVGVIQVLKSGGLTGRWALLLAAGLSLAGVALWGYSTETFSRGTTWDYVAGYVAVFTSAAGAFGIAKGTPEAASAVAGAVKTMTGTGN